MTRAAEIRQQITALEAELAAIAGEPLRVYDRDGDRPVPDYGYVLEVSWAVSDQSYGEWYPTLERVEAAIESLARQHDRKVERAEGWLTCVDLTAQGCNESIARIRPLEKAA